MKPPHQAAWESECSYAAGWSDDHDQLGRNYLPPAETRLQHNIATHYKDLSNQYRHIMQAWSCTTLTLAFELLSTELKTATQVSPAQRNVHTNFGSK